MCMSLIHMNFNPIIVLFLTYSQESQHKHSTTFQSYYSLISNHQITLHCYRCHRYFNPIIVLFLTVGIAAIKNFINRFQSYYSLISNSPCSVAKNDSKAFQSYYSLISNFRSYWPQFNWQPNFNPIIVLFLTPIL